MKIFIIFALIAITAATEWKLKSWKDYDKMQDDCVARYHVPEELREQGKYDKFTPISFQPTFCMFRGLEIWNDSDGFSVERMMIVFEISKNIIENYNEKLLREGVVKCSDKNIEGSSPFDWAYRCFMCFVDNKPLLDAMKTARFYQGYEEEE